MLGRVLPSFSPRAAARAHGVPPTALSCTVIDTGTGRRAVSFGGGVSRSTASVGKLLLLVELAERLRIDPALRDVVLDRRRLEPVGDSGLWQHLRIDTLTVDDAAVLVGAVSDNLATNALVELIGLEAVERRAASCGLVATRLHDVVREERRSGHPPRLSTGTTDELAALMARLWTDRGGAGGRVLDWIAHGTDLSMVARAFGLDPLAHGGGADRGMRVWSKTGTDVGVRADVGVAAGDGRALAYAAIVNWTVTSPEDPDRDRALGLLEAIGTELRRALAPASTSGRLDP